MLAWLGQSPQRLGAASLIQEVRPTSSETKMQLPSMHNKGELHKKPLRAFPGRMQINPHLHDHEPGRISLHLD